MFHLLKKGITGFCLSLLAGLCCFKLGTMIGSSDFWEKEKDAPLLNRNDDFFRPESADELLKRAQKLLELLDERNGQSCVEPQELRPDCDDPAAQRIFLLDAERTFKSPDSRKKLVEASGSIRSQLPHSVAPGKGAGNFGNVLTAVLEVACV